MTLLSKIGKCILPIGGAFLAADLSKGMESTVGKIALGAFGYVSTAVNACGGGILTAAPIASGIGFGVGLAALFIQSKVRNGTFKFWR